MLVVEYLSQDRRLDARNQMMRMTRDEENRVFVFTEGCRP